MIEDVVWQLLSESAQKVLETMFFTAPERVSSETQRPPGNLITASLTFQGAPPGWFRVAISEATARSLAANFLGVEDETRLLPGQVAEVIGELTNMIAGAVLSELESNANFDLGPPSLARIGVDEMLPDFSDGSPSISRFEFTNGALLLFFAFEAPV